MGLARLGSRAIIGTFFEKLEETMVKSWVSAVSMKFSSDQASEEYKWLGMAPVLREWIGARQAKGLKDYGITIPNKTFESTLEVSVDDHRRDKTGQILIRVSEQATRAAQHWNQLLSSLIAQGEEGECYDGQHFFDEEHQEGLSGSQSNIVNVNLSDLPVNQHGSSTRPSPEEMELAIIQGVIRLLSFKDDQGEPLNDGASKFVVMVPLGLLGAATSAVTNPVLTSGKTNTIVNTSLFNLQVEANSRLNWGNQFVIFRADGQVKPFIRQEEEGVTVSSIATGTEEEIIHNRHLYAVKAIRNVGYGYWQHATLVKLV